MSKIFLLLILSVAITQLTVKAQKRYGYAVLGFRCGNQDPERNRLYYSPVIELNTLNFREYTEGIDPAIPLYSVRYYNYAISRWFEMYLKKYHNIQITDPFEYERKFISIVFNTKNAGSCNEQKTDTPCFFTDKNELAIEREDAIRESKLPKNAGSTCEVISLP